MLALCQARWAQAVAALGPTVDNTEIHRFIGSAPSRMNHMSSLNRRALLGAGAELLSAPAFAQGRWPDRPIRLVVAFPAGSVTDTLMRHLAEPLTRELGQPVIVDNRPGGNGVVGTERGAFRPGWPHLVCCR